MSKKITLNPEESFNALLQKLNYEFRFDDDIREVERFGEEWMGTVLLVPPVDKNYWEWMNKADETAKAGNTVVVVCPARTGDEWFHDFVLGKADDVRFSREVVPFEGSDGKGKVNMPAVVVVYRPVTGFVLNLDTTIMGYVTEVFMKVNVQDNQDGFGNSLYRHLGQVPKERMKRMVADFLTRQ